MRFLFIISLVWLLNSSHQQVIKPAVGDKAPPIVIQSPEGKTFRLSDLKGKVVLIDFWASWCRTCRIENASIKQTYSNYKNRSFDIGSSFEIFSISLDKDKSQWIKAIENDRLYWDYHGSDFKKWDSPLVESYNFKFLPFNVLVDGNGTIVAKNLWGNKLKEFLSKHVK